MNTVDQGIKYARDVCNGTIIAGWYILLACKKFLKELNGDEGSRYYFNKRTAQKVLSFFNNCIKHVGGDELAGSPYILAEWEVWILINIFGFVHKDDHITRKHKTGIIFVARKNSKSTLSAGISLYHLIADNNIGAQVYSVATQRDQAKIVWNTAKAMINLMPKGNDYFQQTIYEIRVDKLNSIYKPLGRDSKSLDGLNVSLAIFDESACIQDRRMHEVITSSQGARKQYLNIHITTAQSNKNTVFFENYKYGKKILDGKIKDDRWFSAFYELDKNDRWDDEKVWIKANPNLNRSVKIEHLRNEMMQAKELPRKQNSFFIYYLNRWVTTAVSWLPIKLWEKGQIDEIKRDGDLYVGVDLSSTSDLTALTFLYRDREKSHYYFETRCFIPQTTYDNMISSNREIYDIGKEEGVLIITKGNAIDFKEIKKYLVDFVQDKNLIEIGYDPHSARSFCIDLANEGFSMVSVRQKIEFLSSATKDVEIHFLRNELFHEKSRFFEWQFNNCTVYTDSNNNIKVRKGDDPNAKIDSMIALIIAMERASSDDGLSFFDVEVF